MKKILLLILSIIYLTISLDVAARPPGLEKGNKFPHGLEKQDKTPHGWLMGGKKGWNKTDLNLLDHGNRHHRHHHKHHHKHHHD